jgi:putative transposase
MLGFDMSERTVSRCLPRRPPPLDAVRRRLLFLRNHRDAIAAMDFFTVPTMTFRGVYVWFVIGYGRRRMLHLEIADHPAAAWVVQQLREAFRRDTAPRPPHL